MPEELLRKKIRKGSTIIAAVSGGPDSVYLLMQCLELKKKSPFTIVIAHINHGLRGKASDLDEVFVKKLARKYKLPFESLRVNLKKEKGNIEETGRNIRYQFFEKL